MFSSMSKGLFRKPNSNSQTPEKYQETAFIEKPSPAVLTHTGLKETTFFQEQQTKSFHKMTNFSAKSSFEQQTQVSGGSRVFQPKLISVGGGKGGIGKSFFSANAAIELAKQGYEVALVDLDFGSANLHTCLGVPCPKVGIFEFISNQVENLETVGVETGVPGLKLFAGGQEFWQQIRPQSNQKIRLISKLQKLNADYVILDLGAGTHVNTLDFFIFSHAGIVVVVPEPTSIENAYVFLKSVMYRKLQSIVKALHQEQSTFHLMENLNNPKYAVPPLTQVAEFGREHPEVAERILQLLSASQLGVVMNQVRTRADCEIGNSITQIAQKYFGFSTDFIGAACYDDSVWKTLRNRRPLCVDAPDSPAAKGIQEIANNISKSFAPIPNLGNLHAGLNPTRSSGNQFAKENSREDLQEPSQSLGGQKHHAS